MSEADEEKQPPNDLDPSLNDAVDNLE